MFLWTSTVAVPGTFSFLAKKTPLNLLLTCVPPCGVVFFFLFLKHPENKKCQSTAAALHLFPNTHMITMSDGTVGKEDTI